MHKKGFKVLGVCVAVATLLAGCGKESAQQAGPTGVAALPQVSVYEVTPSTTTMISVLQGRTSPYLVAEVRPQVTGILQKRLFTEGAEVKEGQQLYQIDPATYRATVDSAKASLANAESVYAQANRTAKRYAKLVKSNAISQQQNDDAQAARIQAAAQVKAAKAALQTAQINLGYTAIKSPISGIIGRSLVTPGALLTANQANYMAVVQTLNPIYVDVNQASTDLLRLRKEVASGRLKAENGEIPVELIMEDGSIYAHKGVLRLSEVSVDEGTGTITLRAEFPNPQQDLLPGMYVRAKLPEGVRENAILIPQKALLRLTNGTPYVLVVNKENRLEQRIVKTNRTLNGQWILDEGLNPGERVVIEGFQRVRPGVPVNVVPLQSEQKTPAKK
ncbi:MAG: efflux RND transporter periplasmic adaptor subunit [Burkholderiaceae bacterium]|nr:efflux RND transporter periplasmic adaptor subunit [Burkholderiaceae bacterium]